MENIEWRFGVAGNIIKSHSDENGNVYYGTKAFPGGTKVYLCGKSWNIDERGSIIVIGMNRFGRMVEEYISIKFIENIREQRIFNPAVLRIIYADEIFEGFSCWKRTAEDKKDVKRFIKEWNDIKKQYNENR